MSEILYIGPDDEGPVCQVCGEAEGGREVACEKCGTIHHEDCWRFVGRCTVFGCGARKYTEPKAEAVAVLHVTEETEAPAAWEASRRGRGRARQRGLVPARRGGRSPAPAHPRDPNLMVVQSRAVDLRGEEVRLDIHAPIEYGVWAGLFFSGLGCWFLQAVSFWPVLAFLFFAALTWTTDCTYFLNNRDRTLDYSRHFMGVLTRYPMFHFNDVTAVAVDGRYHSSKNSSYWMYTPVAILKNGSQVSLTDSARNDTLVPNQNGAAFARHLGVRFHRNPGMRELNVRWEGARVVAEYKRRWTLFGALFGE